MTPLNEQATRDEALIMIGGGGNDRIILDSFNTSFLESGQGRNNFLARIDGGTDSWIASQPVTEKGGDVLALDGDFLSLDLTKVKQNSIQNIEIIDLTGSEENILTLTTNDVVDITNENNILRISGEGDDKVNSAGWCDTGSDKVVNDIT